jgi:hypothetical protein
MIISRSEIKYKNKLRFGINNGVWKEKKIMI